MLKLSIPGVFTDNKYSGQVAYGVSELPDNGREAVAQKWLCWLLNSRMQHSLALTMESTGPTCAMGPDDRFLSRIDQGERYDNIKVTDGNATVRSTIFANAADYTASGIWYTAGASGSVTTPNVP